MRRNLNSDASRKNEKSGKIFTYKSTTYNNSKNRADIVKNQRPTPPHKNGEAYRLQDMPRR